MAKKTRKVVSDYSGSRMGVTPDLSKEFHPVPKPVGKKKGEKSYGKKSNANER